MQAEACIGEVKSITADRKHVRPMIGVEEAVMFCVVRERESRIEKRRDRCMEKVRRYARSKRETNTQRQTLFTFSA